MAREQMSPHPGDRVNVAEELWNGDIAVLRRCGQTSLVQNDTGNVLCADIGDEDADGMQYALDAPGLSVGPNFSALKKQVLAQQYVDINCLSCRHNSGMRLEFGRTYASLLVNCANDRDMSHEAFVLTDGGIHAEYITYCYPAALTPWELKDRAEKGAAPPCPTHVTVTPDTWKLGEQHTITVQFKAAPNAPNQLCECGHPREYHGTDELGKPWCIKCHAGSGKFLRWHEFKAKGGE